MSKNFTIKKLSKGYVISDGKNTTAIETSDGVDKYFKDVIWDSLRDLYDQKTYNLSLEIKTSINQEPINPSPISS